MPHLPLRLFLTAVLLVTGVAHPLRARAQALTGVSIAASAAATVEAQAPAQNGTSAVTLGTTFRVEWTRDGEQYQARIRRLDNASYWRLSLQFRFAPTSPAITVGYNEIPVQMALDVPAAQQPREFYWFWNRGLPHTLSTTAIQIRMETENQHGFFLIRRRDGGLAAQLAVDSGQAGDTIEIRFRVTPAAAPAVAETSSRRLSRSPQPVRAAAGFIGVDEDGSGFVAPDGTPWRSMGRNSSDFVALPDSEQEQILEQMAASGMNTLRILLQDWIFRPLPGQVNDVAIERLRDTLDRCEKYGIRVTICLEYSAAPYQYNASVHLSPAWTDLYLLDETADWYAEIVRRVVTPLAEHPAILSWNVSNEPKIAPDAGSLVQLPRFRAYLRDLYPDIAALRRAWSDDSLSGFDTIPLPSLDSFRKQSTAAAREFFRFANAELGRGLIRRALLVREAGARQMITVGAGNADWNPILLRGLDNAGIFDYWSPHTYDLWVNRPSIADHVYFLTRSLRHALPDRPRPVLIEEFGISPEDPVKYPEPLRAEHIRLYREAVLRWNGAGLLHWWEMTPPLYAAYSPSAAADTSAPVGPASPMMGVYLPPSQIWNLTDYDLYPVRRRWDQALRTAAYQQGYQSVFIRNRDERGGCERLLVLGDRLMADEIEQVRSFDLPVYVLPGAAEVLRQLPGAIELPNPQ